MLLLWCVFSSGGSYASEFGLFATLNLSAEGSRANHVQAVNPCFLRGAAGLKEVSWAAWFEVSRAPRRGFGGG